jgi:hypothetical protein
MCVTSHPRWSILPLCRQRVPLQVSSRYLRVFDNAVGLRTSARGGFLAPVTRVVKHQDHDIMFMQSTFAIKIPSFERHIMTRVDLVGSQLSIS